MLAAMMSSVQSPWHEHCNAYFYYTCICIINNLDLCDVSRSMLAEKIIRYRYHSFR